VLLELIIATFVTAYVAVVAVGHILLVAAIYKCPREDGSSGRGRRSAVRPPIAAATPINPAHKGLWSRNRGEPIPQP
jgi:hypothetical protein